MPNRKKEKIVIVEDEPSLVFTLCDTLENEGFDVYTAENGNGAVGKIKEVEPDLLLLDIMLPGKSGYDICQEVRDLGYTFPVIMLTARDQEIDKVTGLNIGADDYITKPFGVKELLARINARLRRSNEYTNHKILETFLLDPYKIDLLNACVIDLKNDETIHQLTTREVELIRFLLTKPNEPISRKAILENVWRYDYSNNTRTVDVHISKLRSKIEVEPNDPRYLVTLHGVGYMLKMN